MFYKKLNEQIISEEFVNAPDYVLSEAGKDEHTYPKDGWYWANNLEEAIVLMVSGDKIPQGITMRQLRLYLFNNGLLDTVENVIATMSKDAQIEWEYSSQILKTHPLVMQLATQLGITDLDRMFAEAGML